MATSHNTPVTPPHREPNPWAWWDKHDDNRGDDHTRAFMPLLATPSGAPHQAPLRPLHPRMASGPTPKPLWRKPAPSFMSQMHPDSLENRLLERVEPIIPREWISRRAERRLCHA